MTHRAEPPKVEVTRLLRVSLLFLGIGLLSTTTWASQILVPGFSFQHFSEVWIEGDLLLLKTEDGRLYSVPVAAVELESIAVEETDAAPTVSDVLELLRAGVSEKTIRAYLESSGARLGISKEDILSLKRGGASEALIQYMIFRGRVGPHITWRSPSAPRKEAPPPSEEREAAYEDQGQVPYFPYVFPGFGAYYPIYPGHPFYPGHPYNPTQPGYRNRSNSNHDLPAGAKPGYYWPETRSLMKPLKTQPERPGRPKPGPYQPDTTRTGGLWLRWKGGSNPGRSGSTSRQGESYSSPQTPGTPSSNGSSWAVAPPRSTLSTGSSGRAGHATGPRSIMGSGSATRSRGQTRSIIKKN